MLHYTYPKGGDNRIMKLKDLLEIMGKTNVTVWHKNKIGEFHIVREGNSYKESDFRGILSREIDHVTVIGKSKISVVIK